MISSESTFSFLILILFIIFNINVIVKIIIIEKGLSVISGQGAYINDVTQRGEEF